MQNVRNEQGGDFESTLGRVIILGRLLPIASNSSQPRAVIRFEQ
jgi:hypothetical protein